ncbi:MAG: LOG family protein [Planctomycetota bacterium]|nr:LOG family protein [Planctomycetota bacterium]
MGKRTARRYRVHEQALDSLIEQLVAKAKEIYGDKMEREFVHEILVTAIRLVRDGMPRGDAKFLNSALKELRHSFRVFKPFSHVRKVACFGSARTPTDHPEWKLAYEFANRITEAGWMVITGAGDGIMGAAQGGAGRDKSFGVNIRLPFEQAANKVIAGDKKLINFRYFFTRKVIFLKESHAIALFPGGFGTHDEGFEALTLVQTGKAQLLPIVFIDPKGGNYWRDLDDYVRKHLLARGMISPEDIHLYLVTDDLDEALHEILNFYSNYHSSRFVDDLLVLRVQHAPTEAQLESLNDEFSDIVNNGGIEVRDAFPEEDEALEYPRVVFEYDRKSTGRLRQLVNTLNSYVPEHASSPKQAAPPEIPEERLPPGAEEAEDEDGLD